MKVFFYTFGCKVNQYETENIRQNFELRGFETTKELTDADIFVINTCTVTAISDKKNRQLIHRIKKENPQSILVLTGCFPQAFEKEAENMVEADIITGTGNKNNIPMFVEEYLLHHNRIIAITSHTKSEKFEPMQNSQYSEKTRAYIKIQDGCDQYCSYCIIPYARGHVRSKSLEEIKVEVSSLADSGHKEIILVGINLSCYGKDTGSRLIEAIEAACSVDSIERVRLGSLEPELLSDEDIKRMSQQPKLCPQFHLSLQSGCDKTLKAMNRKYTADEYFKIVEKLRSSFDDCAITTDIMVGFPEETDNDFKESLAFVEKVGFAKSHIFPYSKREGTVAAKRGGQVFKSDKEKRAKKMAQITDISHHDFLAGQIGKTVPVLFETAEDDYIHGYTPNYVLVKVKAENIDNCLKNAIKCVKILRLEENSCIGEIVK